MSPYAARRLGRTAALAGRPAFSNPFDGDTATWWREGYAAVPDAERGTQAAAATVSVMTPRGKGRYYGQLDHEVGSR